MGNCQSLVPFWQYSTAPYIQGTHTKDHIFDSPAKEHVKLGVEGLRRGLGG